ncbi:helix-turn-helix domain-containing protein [Lutimonas sp.]|uniref:helix-turn-helix domain-containing protein n=1 Tax=Lutimonas sp. TaxID=1872403 RepID=UPI003D9BC820
MGLFLFTHKRGNKRNNRLLGFLFVLIAWNMVDLTLQMNGFFFKWQWIHFIDSGFFLLYGPIIYLYAKGVMYKDFELTRRDVLHLIPYVLLLILMFSSNRWKPPGTSEEIMNSMMSWQFYVISGFVYVHFLLYLLLTSRSISGYRKVIKNEYSQIDQINLDWLSFSVRTFGLLTLVSLIQNFIALAQNETVFMVTLILLLFFVFYFVNRVILKALKQPEIFAGIEKNETSKYAGSNLTKKQLSVYKNELLALVESEKPYLDPQVNLSELSKKIQISSKNLSQVINQSFGKSFFDFINSYRIKEVQKILRETKDEKLTVSEAMYDAGFSSKSSFNTAFKKETGQTPTEFRKSLK